MVSGKPFGAVDFSSLRKEPVIGMVSVWRLHAAFFEG